MCIRDRTVSWHVLDDGIGDIGIIKITSFDAKTPDQFTDAIDSLCLEGVTSLVFDVRDNPGGELTSILSILDMLLPEGPIIRIVGSDGNEDVYKRQSEFLMNSDFLIFIVRYLIF